MKAKREAMKPVESRKVRLAFTSLFIVFPALLMLSACDGAANERGAKAASAAQLSSHNSEGQGTVSSRLGGFSGILAFLETSAVPAELADPEIAPFFSRLTETPSDIEQCLAMLLDHDLGGESPESGAVLADGHKCRGSMEKIHRGLGIPDRIVTKFILIVGQQAALAGIAPADIQAVADALDSYRDDVRNQ